MLLLTVGQLADELGVGVDEVVASCRAHGISVFSERSPLTGGEAQRVRAALGGVSDEVGPSGGGGRSSSKPARATRPPRPEGAPSRVAAVARGLVTLLVLAGIVAGAWYLLTQRDDETVGPDDVAVATVPTSTPSTTTSSTSTTSPPTTAPPTTAPPPPPPTTAVPPPGPGAPSTPGVCFNAPEAVVPCDAPHEAEAFASITHPAGPAEPWPGDEAMAAYGDDQCTFRFASFVGQFPDLSSLGVRVLAPDATTWAAGDRAVTCAVVTKDGSLLVGSVAGSGR